MVHVTARHYHLHDQYFNWFTLFLNQISRFGTPLFAVISGFLLYNSLLRGSFSTGRFIKSRLYKIVIPFLIWSFVYFWVRNYPFPWLENGKPVSEFITRFLLGDAFYHLYFIIVVLQFYLLFLLLRFAKTKEWLITLTVLSFFINYFYIGNRFEVSNGFLNAFFNHRAFIFNWIFFFFLGGLFAYYWQPVVGWLRKNVKLLAVLSIIVVVFSVYEYTEFGMYSSTRVANLFNIPVIFLFLAGMYFVFNQFEKVRSFFIHIGNLSMGIYLVHSLVLYYLTEYFPVMFYRTRWILLAYIIAVLLSIIIVKVIHKLPFGSFIVTVALNKKRNVFRKK